MFAQVIMGKVTDPEEYRERMWVWEKELAPAAKGFLGSTMGIAADNMSCAVAMFDSRSSARENSTRPDQHQWWMETEKVFHAQPTFYDCEQAETYLEGPSPKAKFVQVMVGRPLKPAEMMNMPGAAAEFLREHRPDLIGGVVGIAGERAFEFAYFTSEKEARQGEEKMKSSDPEMKKMRELYESIFSVESYYDLSDPHHMTAKR